MGAKEACGVVGAHSTKGDRRRPEDTQGAGGAAAQGAGVVGHRHRPGKPVFKRMGLAFNWVNFARELVGYKGPSGIGHVRYSTKGRSNLGNAQPIQIGHRVHHRPQRHHRQRRGAAEDRLAARLQAPTAPPTPRPSGYRLLQILKEENDWFWAFERLSKELMGAYSFIDPQQAGRGLRRQGPAGLQAPLHRVAREVGHLHRRLGELRPHGGRRRVRPGRRAGRDDPPWRAQEGLRVVQVRAQDRDRLLLLRVHLLRPSLLRHQRRERLRGQEEGREDPRAPTEG